VIYALDATWSDDGSARVRDLVLVLLATHDLICMTRSLK
jgi:hypothetical protein